MTANVILLSRLVSEGESTVGASTEGNIISCRDFKLSMAEAKSMNLADETPNS